MSPTTAPTVPLTIAEALAFSLACQQLATLAESLQQNPFGGSLLIALIALIALVHRPDQRRPEATRQATTPTTAYGNLGCRSTELALSAKHHA